jgi:zinc transport system ATP-binding protein
LLSRLHTEKGLTILLISHDLDVVYRYADEVLCLNKKLVSFGKPQEMLTAQNLSKLYGNSGLFQHTHTQK